ncbi:uncharacterized protein [Clinocottus analis]|uniref:uncharacterized protein n=1 Tax=Clinocottus analis TaxID=304258 RepID=UPI0035C05DCA
MVINQTSFVDMSMIEILNTTINSTTSIPLLESSATTLTSASESVSEEEESPDSAVPTNPPSMFSTSMTPTRLSPTGDEEELITTDSPTIKEEHEDNDDGTLDADFNVDDFVSENVTHLESVPHRGDTFSKPQHTTDNPAFEEPDDQSIIEISTIQPDVRMPDVSLSTDPMFAKGNTEETILDDLITGAMTDTPTESTELTSEEVFSSPDSYSTNWHHSTTTLPDYDEIETVFAVEGLPPTPPPKQDLSSSPLDTASIIDGKTTPSATTSDTIDTTYICNTQPGSEVEITTTEPPKTTSTARQSTSKMQDVETPAIVPKDEATLGATPGSTAPIDIGISSEDMTSSTSVHIFDEFTRQVPEHSGDYLTEFDTVTEMGREYFTSATIASAVADKTTTPGAVVADVPSIQGTAIIENVSVEQALLPQDSQSPPLPVVPDHPTPSIADGEPIQQSGDLDLSSQTSVTISPTVSFINGKHKITLEPQTTEEKEAKGTQILTNVTSLGASDELTTVFDESWTYLPVDSLTESTEEQSEMLASPEIPDVDEYDTDIIPIVESTPPHILPEEDELIIKDLTHTDTTSVSSSTVEETVSKSTQKPGLGPAHTVATEGMSDVTSTSDDFVPTVTPAEPHITKATNETQTPKTEEETTSVISTSVQEEAGESGRTPTYVKKDSEVTQTDKAKDQSPVTSSTKLYTASDKAETTENIKSTSATPAAEESTQLQTVYTPSSTDPEGKTSTTSDSQSSTQDEQGGKETQAPKEFAFISTAPSVSRGSASPAQTAKTEIQPSASVGPILAETSPDMVTNQDIEGKEIMSGTSMAESVSSKQHHSPLLRRVLETALMSLLQTMLLQQLLFLHCGVQSHHQ